MDRNIRSVAIIAGKDLRQQLRNGTLLVFAVILPLGLAVLFNTIMGGDGNQLRGEYGVVDEDGGALAATFTDQVLAAIAAETDLEVRPVASRAEATALTEADELSATFVIPAGFTTAVEAGRQTTITVVGNPEASIAALVAREIAESYTTELRGVQLAVAMAVAQDPSADPRELAAQAAAIPAPVTIDINDTAANRQLDSPTYFAAGMAVFFLFFTAMLSVTSLLRERSDGTLARLLAAPVGRPTILVGKLAATVVVGVAAMTVLVGASTLLLGASWGDPLGVAALVIATVLAATGMMSLVASLARTSEQASNWMSVLAVLFGLFGGSFVPLAQLGGLAAVSYATPHRWFLQGLSDLAGGELTVVLTPAAALLGFAAVAFTLTALRIGQVLRP